MNNKNKILCSLTTFGFFVGLFFAGHLFAGFINQEWEDYNFINWNIGSRFGLASYVFLAVIVSLRNGFGK